jgi:hypothetical protein
MVPFVGGVRDQTGRRAFVPLAGRMVVAVDLAAGTVLWRKERIGRPIAATERRLVTFDRDGPAFRLRLFDAADGREIAALDAPGIPAWAGEAGSGEDVVQVIATPADDEIHLAWQVRGQYRGGAPPRPDIAVQARRQASGTWRLDLESLSLREAAAVEDAASASDAADAGDRASDVSTDPNVVAIARVGDRLFALKTVRRESVTVITLEARGAADGVLWEVVLGETGAGPPRALRK